MSKIHPTALVDSKAEIGPDVEIGPFCIIEGNVRIDAGCRLLHSVYVTGWTIIGPGCEVHPHAVLGHVPQDIKYHGERSYCRIGEKCIIREAVTVHRGTIPESETLVGNECFLLAGSHVGHNCSLGNKVTLINNVLLAGHVSVGERATIGGGTPIHQFARIGELAMVAGGGRVRMDIPPFALADDAGRVAGLNRIGLRRNEYPREEVAALREAYRILYGQKVDFSTAVERLSAWAKTPATLRLVEFLKAPSKRGIARSSRRGGHGDDLA